MRNRRVAYVLIFEELRIKITKIDNSRRAAERELEALQNPKELIGELEADRDALLDSLADVAPDALNSLAPEERHHVYKMLKLRVAEAASAGSQGSDSGGQRNVRRRVYCV